ncbi:hypothetical protein [Pseudoruegeria sp. HB172150]|uniref:hypothetical protein n=1 Tax=Pseudoruegeria sp. HB172150 TaxID=2721164 RepID=UPI0015578D61|nr:hypothetical protein [Pseudoruegeria sp. HB172150]
MKIFPKMVVKRFLDCAHGEFIYFSSGVHILSAICLHEENGRPKVLILAENGSKDFCALAPISKDMEVQSIGLNWILRLSDPFSDPHIAENEEGVVSSTDKGTYITVKEYRSNEDRRLFCCLENPDIVNADGYFETRFHFRSWTIEYYDSECRRRRTLAVKSDRRLALASEGEINED